MVVATEETDSEGEKAGSLYCFYELVGGCESFDCLISVLLDPKRRLMLEYHCLKLPLALRVIIK